jgi:hypothetical protein
MTRGAVVFLGTAIVALLAACVSVSRENVTHAPGRVKYPGYSVDYVEATPSPGSAVIEGTTVTFSIRVQYSLMLTERGRVQLQFEDEKGRPLLVGKELAIEIVRTGSSAATLSQQVVVPGRVWDLVACVFVVPEGEREPLGALRIRYPVAKP